MPRRAGEHHDQVWNHDDGALLSETVVLVQGLRAHADDQTLDGLPLIPADGVTAATVTYYADVADGTDVTFDVNGATVTEQIQDRRATIEVTSETAGDTITVKAEGYSTVVAVEA